MSMSRLLLIAVLAFLGPSMAGRASADALPNCPPGTRMVMNPTPPGSMHHGGGSCVAEDPPVNPPPPVTPPPVTPPEPEAPPASTSTPPASAPATSSTCSVSAPGAGSDGMAFAGLVGLALTLARRRR